MSELIKLKEKYKKIWKIGRVETTNAIKEWDLLVEKAVENNTDEEDDGREDAYDAMHTVSWKWRYRLKRLKNDIDELQKLVQEKKKKQKKT